MQKSLMFQRLFKYQNTLKSVIGASTR